MEQYIKIEPIDNSHNTKKEIDMDRPYVSVLKALLNYRSSDGRILANTFLDREKYIYDQFSLKEIKQKVEIYQYPNLQAFSQDIQNFFLGIKNHSDVHSELYKDGAKLLEIFVSELHRIQIENSTNNNMMTIKPHVTSANIVIKKDDEQDIIIELLNYVINYSDPYSNQILSEPFQSLPSKNKYPDYYKVINEPIDLNIIMKKINNNIYPTMNSLYNDLSTMFNNAKTYNEPGSWIFKVANQLKKAMTLKKVELEQRHLSGHKFNEKKNITRSANTTQTIIEDEYILDSNQEGIPREKDKSWRDSLNASDDGPGDPTSDPRVYIFNAIKDYQNPTNGNYLSDPFLRLPSSYHYKDYYEEIKKPIALTQIKTKIKKNQYPSLEELVDDLNLMFDNATTYNMPDSQIYKDAVFLKNLLKSKLKEVKTIDFSQGLSTSKRWSGHMVASTPTKIRHRQDGAQPQQPVQVLAGEKGPEYSYAQEQEKLFLVFDDILEYKDDKGHIMAHHFLSKPDPAEVPAFYRVLHENGARAIDLTDIENGLKNGKYMSFEVLLSDLYKVFEDFKQLLFSNPSSEGHKAAERLQAILTEKLKTHSFVTKVLKSRLIKIYNEFVNYEDTTNQRRLSAPFLKLPSKLDYPDYYDVVKKPLDLMTINYRIMKNAYPSPEEFFADLDLMLENAFKYNDPESVLYKDALQMCKLSLEKKTELLEEIRGKPDVQLRVHTILTSIYVSVINHKNGAGRYLSDSLQEMAQTLTERTTGLPSHYFPPYFSGRSMTLELIKKYLDNGYYKRLDVFQEHMLYCLKKALYVAKPGSQAVSDATDLVSVYFAARDQYCRRGALLESLTTFGTDLPLVKDILSRLGASDSSNDTPNNGSSGPVQPTTACPPPVEGIKTEAQLTMATAASGAGEDEDCVTEETNSNSNDVNSSFGDFKRLSENASGLEGHEINGITYYPGDFVYLAPSEPGIPDPHIMCIQQFAKDPETGELCVQGCWFYRPYETYHMTSRRFYEKEVFKSDFYDKLPASKIVGKCCVMFIRDYAKYRPLEFENKDIYVCEAKYLSRLKTFKKMKMWNHVSVCNSTNPAWKDRITFVVRDAPLQMVKAVPSMFLDKSFSEFMDDNTYVPPFPEPSKKDVPLQATVVSGDFKVAVSGGPLSTHYHSVWWPKTVSSGARSGGLNLNLGDYVLIHRALLPRQSSHPPAMTSQYVLRIDELYRTDSPSISPGIGELHLSGKLRFVFEADTPGQRYPRNAKDVFCIPPDLPLDSEAATKLPSNHVTCSAGGGEVIVRKVVVLGADTFSKKWPTEIPEVDIYVCRYQFTSLPQLQQHDGSASYSSTASITTTTAITPILYETTYPRDAPTNCPDVSPDEWYHFDVVIQQQQHHHHQHAQQQLISSQMTLQQQRSVSSSATNPSALSDLLATHPADDKHRSSAPDEERPSLKEVFFGSSSGTGKIVLEPFQTQSPRPSMIRTPGGRGPTTNTAYNNSNNNATNALHLSTGSLLIDDDDFKYIQRKAKPSGYIVFSGERRKAVMDIYPDLMFGDISKVIGNEWKQLSLDQKAIYEAKANVRAQELRSSMISLVSSQGVCVAPGASIDYNQLLASLSVAPTSSNTSSPSITSSPSMASSPGGDLLNHRLSKRVLKLIRKSKQLKRINASMNGLASQGSGQPEGRALTTALRVYTCGWGNCNFQFEDEADLIDHMTLQANHIQAKDGEYTCQWNNCNRSSVGGSKDREPKPFLTQGRLVRHLKESHFRHCVKYLYPDQLNKNCVRSSNKKRGSVDDQDSNNSGSLFNRVGDSSEYGAGEGSNSFISSLGEQSRDRFYGGKYDKQEQHQVAAAYATPQDRPLLFSNGATNDLSGQSAGISGAHTISRFKVGAVGSDGHPQLVAHVTGDYNRAAQGSYNTMVPGAQQQAGAFNLRQGNFSNYQHVGPQQPQQTHFMPTQNLVQQHLQQQHHRAAMLQAQHGGAPPPAPHQAANINRYRDAFTVNKQQMMQVANLDGTVQNGPTGAMGRSSTADNKSNTTAGAGNYLTAPKPLFVIPPPSVTRTVRHSEIYTKYIERLIRESGNRSDGFQMEGDTSDAPPDVSLPLSFVKVAEPAKGLRRKGPDAVLDKEMAAVAKIKALHILKDQMLFDALRVDNWVSSMPDL